MKPTKQYTFTISAFGVYRLQVAGDYFKILSATGIVKVNSPDWGELRALTVGQGLENAEFSDLFFTDESGANNTITVYVGDRNFIDGVTGDVRVINTPAVTVTGTPTVNVTQSVNPDVPFTQAQGSVTAASTQALAAKANRQFLLIQNNDATAIVYVTLDGTAATTAKGIKLNPGASLMLDSCCPTAAVNWIGSGATTNVVVVEG